MFQGHINRQRKELFCICICLIPFVKESLMQYFQPEVWLWYYTSIKWIIMMINIDDNSMIAFKRATLPE